MNNRNSFDADKIRPPNRGGDLNTIAVFGSLPPNRESFEDLCGPPTTCPDCPEPKDFKCKETLLTLYDLVGNLEIKQAENRSYALLPNRTFGKLSLLINFFCIQCFKSTYSV